MTHEDTTPARTRFAGHERARLAVVAAWALAMLSLLACVTLSVLQLSSRASDIARYRSVPAVDPVPAETPTSTGASAELLSMLPARIDGYRTAARHYVPGLGRTAAEAIYVPEAEEVSVRTPLSCYVTIRYPEGGRVDAELRSLGAKYASRVEPPAIGFSTPTLFAATVGDSTRIAAWEQAGHIVLVDTRFTVATPVKGDELLRAHTEAVANAVAGQIGR